MPFFRIGQGRSAMQIPLGSNVESPVKKVNHQQVDVIIVAPFWKGQSWFLILLSLLFDFPHLILYQHVPYCLNTQCHPVQASRCTIGRMVHLREYCQTKKFSEQALELHIVSWQHESTKSYNSLFHNWECWCTQQNGNPIWGPVVEISNFWQNYIRRGTLMAP